MEKLKPAIVLSAITSVIGALLIVCTNLVPDTSGIITESLRKKCVMLMGEGDFNIVDWGELPDGVKKVIQKDDGSVAFEISVRGYNDGYDLLVAMNSDGSVRGVTVVSSNETIDVGAKFYESFKGVRNGGVNSVEVVSGATKSSKGVKKAVEIAIDAFAGIGGGT